MPLLCVNITQNPQSVNMNFPMNSLGPMKLIQYAGSGLPASPTIFFFSIRDQETSPVWGNCESNKYPLMFEGNANEVHRAPECYWVLEGNQRLNGSRILTFEVKDFPNTPPTPVATPPANPNPPTFTSLTLLFWVDSSDNYPRQTPGTATDGKAGTKQSSFPAPIP